jgi:hypothetical protein
VAHRMTPKITFDTPPTIDQMMAALEEMRPVAGGDAVLRVSGVIEFDLNGPRVAAICAEPASTA